MARTTFFEFLSEWETFKKEFDEFKTKVLLLETKTRTEEEKSLEIKSETKFPVPPDYLNIVEVILNKNFGVEYEPRIDIPSFQLSILVPPKYNPLMHGNEDRRLKVISNAEGQSGVKTWAEVVWNTFDPNMQASIIADRE